VNGNREMVGVTIPHSIQRAPASVCTGPLWAETLIDSAADGENSVVRATCEPGVITNWHSHPRGQVLYAVFGTGRMQRQGGEIETIRAGECVRFAANELHWHGAASGSCFVYVSVQAMGDGKTVVWSEPV
jgi:quercetin dioxygenase-like cupin family protein